MVEKIQKMLEETAQAEEGAEEGAPAGAENA